MTLLKHTTRVIARNEGKAGGKGDEAIPHYIVRTKYKDWDCFTPSHISTLPFAMTEPKKIKIVIAKIGKEERGMTKQSQTT